MGCAIAPRSTAVFRVMCLLAAMTRTAGVACADWTPVEGTIMTRWAREVSPENVLPEYPRPQMVRSDWMNLNGLWEYAIQPREESAPETYDGAILVPFPVESALSGVKKRVGQENRLWYRRRFRVPETWSGQQVRLRFGAVDWETTVWVNGTKLGTHRGGYDPFSFDITDELGSRPEHELILAVWDPTSEGTQPRGKQVIEPRGIWYTPVTGIWQTVWLEPAGKTSVEDIVMVPDIDAGELRLSVQTRNVQDGDIVKVVALDGDRVAARTSGPANGPVVLKLKNPKLWSPDSPFLYGVEIALERDGETIDAVSSYFGMRKSSVEKDKDGFNRLFLNNEPLFQFGPLDQGWWPDGLYTAPTDAALEYDVRVTKELGFNMIRKHVKIEPARWYYHCDRHGIVVWQDMPSAEEEIGGDDSDMVRSPESATQYNRELQAMIDTFRNHPSIVMWVPFNEGWGQFETGRISAWIKVYDPSRLVNEASGWANRGTGDVRDVHSYPGPGTAPVEPDRAVVLGEFGGLGLPMRGHLWEETARNWGYREFGGQAGLREGYKNLIRRLRPLIGEGLSAAVYTQTTDVETEVNGLMTYDRELVKLGADWLAEVNSRVYLPPPISRTLLPTSQEKGRRWRYTTDKPAEGWQMPGFDDSAWKQAVGVFGTESRRGPTVRTTWDTPEIWLRRTFQMDDDAPGDVFLDLLHGGDAEVYINGVPAAEAEGRSRRYATVSIAPAARAALKKGANVIATHCTQSGRRNSIDVGIVTVIEQTP